MGDTLAGLAAGILYLSVIGLGIASWFTHVAYCFTHGEWGFLIAGAIIFPLANVHGIGLWFGWWG
jgi:hypothetical protein